MKNHKENNAPQAIFSQYKAGIDYKATLGDRGLFDQSKMNERFYVGDQWHGANVGNRPLVRHNIIRRIGEYKRAVIVANPIAVNYSAEGVPNTTELTNSTIENRRNLAKEMPENAFEGMQREGEVALVMSALSDYHKVTAERVKFDYKKDKVIRNAYISGTGILYTYWDSDIRTGLYADEGKKQPIKGDIACEVLNVENVVFGEPNNDDVQSQPYIIVSQRKSVGAIKREARANGMTKEDINNIKPDSNLSYESGDRGETEPQDSKRATVITKFFKVHKADGTYSIHGIKVTENAVIRREWDLKISLYPICVYAWEQRNNCIYGDSEITYLIPNQIAINRILTAGVWAQMMNGMPIMVKDADMVLGPVSNMPGEIIKVNAGGAGIGQAIGYISPPAFAPQYQGMTNDMISTTLSCAGANDAALGNVDPKNTSALVVAREAATMPMQLHQNRFYQFCEDAARIWAEMWLKNYGKRMLKIEDESGVWYLPFDAEKYRDLLLSVRVDVGASTLWGEGQVISTLGNLLTAGIITPLQYLKRLPKNSVPDLTGLIREMQSSNDNTATDVETILTELGLTEEEKQQFYQLPPEQQQQILSSAFGAGNTQNNNTGGQMNGNNSQPAY